MHTEIMSLKNEEAGFHVLLNHENWRVAVSNLIEDEKPLSFEKHLETDEVFVLLKGQGFLLEAGTGKLPNAVKKVKMERNGVYNVPKGVWHAHQMKAGSRLLIVENADTGDKNSQKAPLIPYEMEM